MRPVLGIAVEAGRVRALALRGRRVRWAAEAEYTGAADLAQVLARLAAERPARLGAARAARVALDPELAYYKVVHAMPRLRPRDLAAHVAREPRRYFLQNGAALVTDAVPLGRANGHAQRPALLAAAPEPLIEAIAEGLAAAGLSLGAIAPARDYLDGAGSARGVALEGLGEAAARYEVAFAAATRSPRLSLLPAALRHRHARLRAGRAWRWAAVGAASLLLATASYVASLARQRAAADAELSQLRPLVAGAIAARADLDRTTDALAILSDAERGRSRPGLLLARITAALPDSAFLAAFRVDENGRGTLVGWAPRAAAVAAALARVEGVRDPVLDGPVTREVVGGRELDRFTLLFRACPMRCGP